MITGGIKQTDAVFPLEVGSANKEEFTVEIKEQEITVTKLNSEDELNEKRFSRLKKSLRKRSVSIL